MTLAKKQTAPANQRRIISLVNKRRFKDAEPLLLNTLQENPDWADGHYYMGCLLRDTDRKELAVKAFHQTVRLAPRHTDGWYGLGSILLDTRQYQDGLYALQKALNLNPKNKHTWARLIEGLEIANLLKEAEKALADAMALFPQEPVFILYKARLCRRDGRIEDACTLIAPLEKQLATDKAENAVTFSEFGQIHDRAKNYDKAFAFFKLSNQCISKSAAAKKVDKNLLPEELDRQKNCFTPEFVKSWGKAPDLKGSPSPVFMIGFPRSGTTLLDQILNSHKDIDIAEERPPVALLRYHLIEKYGEENYPACLAELTDTEIKELRDLFFSGHQKYGGDTGKTVFIDKLPLNIYSAGLIHRIFPHSPFILSLRHPCDCVLSCFMQSFELNEAMIQFLDINDAARFYDAVFDLWEHFQTLLPLRVHTVKYEDLIHDTEAEIRNALSFLNVEWDKDIMNYRGKIKSRQINTPSYSQVTEKIHNRAKDRWQNYSSHLEPAMATLSPWIEKHGYLEK